MKRKLITKSSSVILAVAIIFTTVFSMSIFASAATKFSPRLSAPASTNKYYYSDINVFYKYGWGMPNCTAYAYGRAYEILKTEPKLSWGNAEDWYSYNKSNGYYSYGKTPKIGAIACWSYDGGGGHVAVVEKIENGKITFSNSAYSGTNFYLSYANTSDSNAGGSSWWNFQGYIYLGDFSGGQDVTTTEATLHVTYKTGTYKTTDALNMRNGVGIGNSVICTIPSGTEIKITNVKSDAYYNWGYTTYNGKNGWVAMTYCKYVEPATVAPTTQPTTAAPTTVMPTVQPTTAEPTTIEPTTEACMYELGDIDNNGIINVFDVTLLQKYLSDMTTLTDLQLNCSDFNGDGRISIIDATSIQIYLTQ